MIARLLTLCGLWLGPAIDLVPPAPDNPEGFFENVHLVGLNEILLRSFGGAWDDPPTPPDGWERRPELEELDLAASELVGRLAEAGPWAWKDPRNSLTLPFWQRRVSDLRVVVCLRNPLEVARSLQERDGMSLAQAFALWDTYYTRLLRDASPEQRVVTHYAAYFDDPQRELERVLAFLGLVPSAQTIRQALATVGPRLRHQRAALPELLAAATPERVVALYASLCTEAAYADHDSGPPAARPRPLVALASSPCGTAPGPDDVHGGPPPEDRQPAFPLRGDPT